MIFLWKLGHILYRGDEEFFASAADTLVLENPNFCEYVWDSMRQALTDREWEVFHARFYEERRRGAVALPFRVDYRRIRQNENSALRKLREVQALRDFCKAVRNTHVLSLPGVELWSSGKLDSLNILVRLTYVRPPQTIPAVFAGFGSSLVQSVLYRNFPMPDCILLELLADIHSMELVQRIGLQDYWRLVGRDQYCQRNGSSPLFLDQPGLRVKITKLAKMVQKLAAVRPAEL